MNSPDRQKKELLSDPMRSAPVVSNLGRANHPARSWQVVATLIGAIAIVWVVLYGLNNQREEGQPNGNDQQAATQITPNAQNSAPAGGNAQANQQPSAQQQAQPQQQQGQANNRASDRSTTGSGGNPAKLSRSPPGWRCATSNTAPGW